MHFNIDSSQPSLAPSLIYRRVMEVLRSSTAATSWSTASPLLSRVRLPQAPRPSGQANGTRSPTSTQAAGYIHQAIGLSSIWRPDHAALVQFRGDLTYYDLSSVDCCRPSQSNVGQYPFIEGGVSFESDNLACPTKRCANEDAYCHDAFILPSDDLTVGVCVEATSNTVLPPCGDCPTG